MELTRIIHPVGQGGFYTETLKYNHGNEFNIVYDCGGNGQKFMSDYLDSYFPKQRTIDIVFVSHFHYDHINGLLHLLKNNNVRFLVIPQLTPELMLEALFYNYQRNGAFNNRINQFLFSIYGRELYENNETRIIQILPNSDDNNDGVMVEEFPINNDRKRYPLVISYKGKKVLVEKKMRSGTVFSVGKWFYVPYNPPVPKKETKEVSFYDYFKKELNEGKDFEFAELNNIVERDLEKCVTLYKEYFKSGDNHNAYSMALFSGMRKPHGRLIMSNVYCCDDRYCDCFYHYHSNPNFLYTGDFEPYNKYGNNIQSMKHFYGSLWDSINTLQVPHHGSRNNFSKELYEDKCLGYISVGEKNRFNHPDKDTLLNIMYCGCVPRIVSDNVSTIVINKFEVSI